MIELIMSLKMKNILILLSLLSSVFWSNGAVSQDMPEPIPVARYCFDGNLLDSLDLNKKLKSKANPLYTKGRFDLEGTAIQLIGNESFELPTDIHPDAMPQLTIALWFKPKANEKGTILGTQKLKALLGSRSILISGDSVLVYLKTDEVVKPLGLPVKPNEWNFIAISFNQEQSKILLFVNGESKLDSTRFLYKKEKVFLAGTTDKADKTQFDLDELLMFDKALNHEQLAQIGGFSIAKGKRWFNLQDEWYWFLILAAFSFSMIFMPYVWYRDWKLYKPVKSIDFERNRKQGMEQVFGEDEANELATSYLSNAFESWTLIEKEDDDEVRSPQSRKDIKKSLEWINKAIALNPTNEQVVNRINELGNIVNNQLKRYFNGNKFLLVISILVYAGLLYFTGKDDIYEGLMKTWWMFVSITVYIAASFTPKFLLEKRERKRGQKRSTSFPALVIATLLGMFYSQPVARRVRRTWSDGTVTEGTEADFSSLFYLLLGIVFAFIFSILIGVIGLVSFFRNYVFYI